MIRDEELREESQRLRAENGELKRAQALNRLLLKGFETILLTQETDVIFSNFFEVLKTAIPFEDAVVLEINSDTSHNLVVGTSDNNEPFINLLLSKIPLIDRPFNIFNFQAFAGEDAATLNEHVSVLTSPIKTTDAFYLLILSASETGLFGPHHQELLKTFTAFTGNTLSQFEARKLRARKEELEAQQDKIQKVLINSEKMASLGHLAAGVAHEINNPLSYVMSNLESLRFSLDALLEKLDAYENENMGLLQELNNKHNYSFIRSDSYEMLDEMLEGTTRVKDIITQLRTFAHPNESKPVEVDIIEVLESTLKIAWNKIKYKATITKIYPEEKTLVIGKPTSLSQVFLNILVNAAQAIDVPQGKIEIAVKPVDDACEISITDNGPGIPVEIIDHVFNPFFTTKDVGKGTGLGLAIAKAIIEQHGGHILIEAAQPRGARVVITLPNFASIANENQLKII